MSLQSADFARQVLAAHNRERLRAGVAPLQWSGSLEGDAAAWAAALARRGAMQHARDTRGQGENLWMGSPGYTPQAMIGGFVAEAGNFRPGRFPEVSRTGNWRDVGHYTQLIWPATRELGCALAHGRSADFLVCRYWPAGNMIGEVVP